MFFFDIIEIIEKEEERKQSAPAARSVAQVIEKEEYGYGSGATVIPGVVIGISNGIFEYGLEAKHDELLTIPVFDYCASSCNVIAGLTAITVATRNKNENSGINCNK